MLNPLRIAIIGNSCGGKTKLAQLIAHKTALPLVHVDQIQFMSGLKFRPYKESIELLKVEQDKSHWIIDGYGPLDILIQRLDLADLVIFIDLPLWIHYYWAFKRTFKNIFLKQRQELPQNCDERNFSHISKLFKTIAQVHTKMRPEMLNILSREHYNKKTIHIRSKIELQHFTKKYT